MDAWHRPSAAVAGLALALAAPAHAAKPAAAADCARIVAVGDLHGAYDGFVGLLERAGLIDAERRWSGGQDCLIQLGDIVDRGGRSREILDLLIALQEQAPGRVRVLVGNHEVMNMMDDLRYVDPGEYAAFAAEESAGEREQARAAFGGSAREFDAAYPPGWFAHRRAFSPDGRYGRWLLEQPILERAGGVLFVHGGLDAADAGKLEELNASLRRDVEAYRALRATLIDRGRIGPLADFLQVMTVGGWSAGASSAEPDAATRHLARQVEALQNGPLLHPDGPLWSRELAEAPEAQFRPTLERILAQAGVSRIVVGHTTTADFRIASRFEGRVFVIDTGAGPAFGGRPSALEIGSEGRIRALYADEAVDLVTADDDGAIEEFLTRAKVIEVREIGSGITRPKKLRLELDGRTRKAAFKDVSVENLGLTRFAGGKAESNFTDDYRYDRAAYLLDRLLGLRMVPVTVLRTVQNKEGAAVDWVEDAYTEEQRRADGKDPADYPLWRRQQALMRLFDALIYNIDRNQGNQLYDPSGRLHLIDHTRAFRIKNELPDLFLATPASLPRELLGRLESLDVAGLQQAMQGLLSKERIKSLLARRDAIVAKIQHDRELHGDGAVFFGAAAEAEPEPAAAP